MEFSIFNFQFSNSGIKSGQAALTAVIFLLFISLAIIFGFSQMALRETRTVRVFTKGEQSYFLAESGQEDAVYRLIKGQTISPSETITLGASSAITDIVQIGNTREISSRGDVNSSIRRVKTILEENTASISFYYGVQVGIGGMDMKNNSQVNGNVYSNGSIIGNTGATIIGDATVAGASNKIQKLIIGNASSGTGRASQFVDTTIHGSACPNVYCIVENPAAQSLPISDVTIQSWKDAATTGGIISGDVTVSGSATTLGPQKITGKLTVTNGSTLTVTGTLWVGGDIVFDNNSIIKLASSYGTLSGVIISDAKIDVKNNAAVSGSGNPSSFMMLLAAKDSTTEEIINVDNNSLGAIYYAGKGWIKFSNNATAKEATAYGIRLDNNAVITYDSGLASAQFSSGSGAGYEIQSWREIE